ncbi:MAG: TIGR02302 family protein [Hyphomicrobiales bacterium]|nr:TIGR02302 family protein [Hyphomicrobiales bacterium]
MPSTTKRSFLDLPRELQPKVARAWLALLWERLWPSLWPLIGVVMAFAVTALAGLWTSLPDWSRACGLILFALFAVAALWPVARIRAPSLAEALHRLEVASAIAHRPATAHVDALPEESLGRAASAGDSTALWRAHKARVAALIARLRAGWPRSALARRDSYALRVLLTLLLIITATVAGPAWQERLISPFWFNGGTGAAALSVDAWVSPPTYTGRAPMFLTGANLPEPPDAIEVPTGSELMVRVHGPGSVALTLSDAPGTAAGSAVEPSEPARENVSEFRAKLSRSATATVSNGPTRIAGWTFTVIPDTAPTIALLDEPRTAVSGALELDYSMQDDYGVTSAEADFGLADEAGGEAADAEEPLIAAPRFPLSLPHIATREGTGRTFKDLLAHPWAGGKARLTLRATDEADNVGESEPIVMELPSRRFTQPLARAVIEQRRTLAQTPSKRPLVARALNALTAGPVGFFDDSTVYLSLRAAYWRLMRGDDRAQMTGVVDLLWDVALRIEDGDLSLAERNLRAAQEALERALAEDAPDEVIKQLIDELRQALNDFMRALSEMAQNQPELLPEIDISELQLLQPQDLQRLLENIENLARNGAREQAMQLLQQLRNMLENMRIARGQQPTEGQQMMSEMLQQLGEMIGKQQQLMDETFRLNGQGDRQGTPQAGQLGQRQRDLQAQLQALLDQLKGMGSRSNNPLDQAGENMGEAAESLGQGDPGGALPEQGQALDNLRQGAQSLAQELAESMQNGRGQARGRAPTDPLGRPLPSRGPELGSQVKVPDEIETQTVRRILEEVRRRLGEQNRPRIELDYLERLLRRF